MKKKVVFLSIVALLISLVGNAISLSKRQSIQSLSFEKRIDIIHARIVDLTDIFALHHVKEFNDVYENPLKFKNSAIQYIQNSHGLEDKIIVMCLMTKLPIDQYIDLLTHYYTLYNKGKINEPLLSRGVFNEFDTDNRLEKEYQNPRVRVLLTNMINCQSLSKQFRKELREALNGKRYNAIKRFKNS